MAGLVARLLRKGRQYFNPPPRGDAAYWSWRAGEHGERSVLHIGHGPDEVEGVTERQKSILLPCLKAELRGSESVILDYGCGPGRFTASLAATIGGRAIGVDPTAELLKLAPTVSGVEYRRMDAGIVPLPADSVDVVWSAIVLGCITTDESLATAASEIKRVLRPGGLLFLIENTSEKKSGPHFVFRTIADYQDLFAPIPLRFVTSYIDLDETISVLCGRAPGPATPE